MTNREVLTAIYQNVRSAILTISGAQFIELREGQTATAQAGAVKYTVAYKGSEQDASIGIRPNYQNSTYDLKVELMDGTMANINDKLFESMSGILAAFSPDAMNVGDLATTKPVTRVSVQKPLIEGTPPNTTITVTISIRHREGPI